MSALDVIEGRARSWVSRGDALGWLATMPTASFDALITDPPAGISFMGRSWDSDKGGRAQWVAWLTGVMAECLRVLKPGAHALVWGLPRTSHWTATAIEDAGFEVRDRIHHVFGTGFPKSLDVGEGRGTALKPAAEDWWLARKPLGGTVAATVAEWGTGALNVDACRVGTSKAVPASPAKARENRCMCSAGDRSVDEPGFDAAIGRWPPNVVLSHGEGCVSAGTRRVRTGDGAPNIKTASADYKGSSLGRESRPAGSRMVNHRAPDGTETVAAWTCAPGCPVAMLDEQSGVLTRGAWDGRRNGTKTVNTFGAFSDTPEAARVGDSGGASRFFPTFHYAAKPSTAEREAGCERLPKRSAAELVGRQPDAAALSSPRTGAGRSSTGRANTHPTVKSLDLMRWLCRLITPAGGVVLDPFAGSGSTGAAALLERLRFVGIEQEAEHVEIARARIAYWDARVPMEQRDLFGGVVGVEAVVRAGARARQP